MIKKKKWVMLIAGFTMGILCCGFIPGVGGEAGALETIRIFIDGKELYSDVPPLIIDGRTMVPIRAISEGMGMTVKWNDAQRQVIITSSGSNSQPSVPQASEVKILGDSVASADALRAVMLKNNPLAPEELPDLYIRIGAEYGIRGDIAFCQAAKETGWWRYGGLVESYQNNYCGLAATGKAATGEEDLRGADPDRVRFESGVHGAIFDSPATGVEAHIQHLYAYGCKAALPAGKSLVDPRFILVTRGIAMNWSDLDGRWAVPGVGYGQSILADYYLQALNIDGGRQTTIQDEMEALKLENQILRMELEELRNQ